MSSNLWFKCTTYAVVEVYVISSLIVGVPSVRRGLFYFFRLGFYFLATPVFRPLLSDLSFYFYLSSALLVREGRWGVIRRFRFRILDDAVRLLRRLKRWDI